MTAFKVGASISIPGAIEILQNFDPKIDVYTDTRISNPQGGDSYIFYTPVYDHNASDWYNDGLVKRDLRLSPMIEKVFI